MVLPRKLNGGDGILFVLMALWNESGRGIKKFVSVQYGTQFRKSTELSPQCQRCWEFVTCGLFQQRFQRIQYVSCNNGDIRARNIDKPDNLGSCRDKCYRPTEALM
jgi:hypothetical protein